MDNDAASRNHVSPEPNTPSPSNLDMEEPPRLSSQQNSKQVGLGPSVAEYGAKVEKTKFQSFWSSASDTWLWESCSIGLSICCLIAIVIILSRIQGKPLRTWNLAIGPNAVISIFSTISKATLLYSVLACISQVKWLYFKQHPRPLKLLQVFDDASRGPLGSLNLLSKLPLKSSRARRFSWPPALASCGAMITVLAVAVDPFVQQVLSYPSRETVHGAGAASINSSRLYDGLYGIQSSNQNNVYIDSRLEGAIMSRLFGTPPAVSVNCQTGNCTMPTFYSLGVCSKCTDVTSHVQTSCRFVGEVTFNVAVCNNTTPSGFNMTTYIAGGAFVSYPNLRMITKNGDNNNDDSLLVEMAILKYNMSGTATSTESGHNPQAIECSMSWCAKDYSEVSVSNGRLNLSSPLEIPFSAKGVNASDQYFKYIVYYPRTPLPSVDYNYTVRRDTHTALKTFLQTTFNNSEGTDITKLGPGVPTALFSSPNISDTIHNVAASMTDVIRERGNNTIVQGSAYQTEPYIHVTWPWLALPASLIAMAALLLAAVIFSAAAAEKATLWKSSGLALLFSDVGRGSEIAPSVDRPSALRDVTDGMSVQLESGGARGLQFLRVSRVDQKDETELEANAERET